MSRRVIRQILLVFVICAAGLFVLLPLLRPGFPVTDDGDWMIIRLSAFYQSLREGQFPVRLLGRLNYSYGYPVADFLYPGFLYIGSFLHLLRIPFSSVVEVLLGGSAVIGAVFIYLWLRHFFDDVASALGTVSFLFMPYLLYDIYKRGSVGEVLAMGLCTAALWIIEERRRWLLPPVIALLAISHNTLAIFFLGALFLYISLKRYWELLVPFAIGVIMSAFFWLPAFFDQKLVLFNRISVSNPREYFAAGEKLIIYGIPFLIAAVLALFIGKRSYSNERWYFFILLAIGGLFATSVTGIVWEFSPFVRVVQFPFRFLALWSFAGPWFIADIANSHRRFVGLILGAVAIFGLLFVALPYQKVQSVVRPEGFYTTNEGTTTVANEYMPTWVSVQPTARASNRLEVTTGNAVVQEHRVTSEVIDVIVRAKEESTLQVNSVYYPGWGAMIDNKPVRISYDNPGGVMRITIPSGDHSVYMAFRETAGRFIADMVTIGAFILYLIVFLISAMRVRHTLVKKKNKI